MEEQTQTGVRHWLAGVIGLTAIISLASVTDFLPEISTNQDSETPQESTMSEEAKTATATFAGGCFWCTEAVFIRLKGVRKVTSGYTGGKVDNPTYRQVCTGATGHAEGIQIVYDPKVIKYEQLLDVHFHTHDPTTLNRQGADEGTHDHG